MAQMIASTTRPAYQAYQLLYVGFVVAPRRDFGLALGVLTLAQISEEFPEGTVP